jgi:hypothetical protein
LDDKEAESIGKRMIDVALNMDESLVDLLRIEIKRLKQVMRNNGTLDEMQKTINLVRSIIITISLTDEKIKTGLDLYLGKIRFE